MLSILSLNATFLHSCWVPSFYSHAQWSVFSYAKCHYAECFCTGLSVILYVSNAECHYAKCHYAERCVFILILSVIMLNAIMSFECCVLILNLSVIMLNVMFLFLCLCHYAKCRYDECGVFDLCWVSLFWFSLCWALCFYSHAECHYVVFNLMLMSLCLMPLWWVWRFCSFCWVSLFWMPLCWVPCFYSHAECHYAVLFLSLGHYV